MRSGLDVPVSLDFLRFLAEPWFVGPWYLVGLMGMAWVIQDMVRNNEPLNQPLKWAWPIIVLFFSVIGIALYVTTSRPPEIGKKPPDAKKRAFQDYSESTFRKVTGSVIHCVGGDGLGIMTAMVIARLLDMSFWMEFWFEYLVGFCFGWFIFQYGAMRKMADGPGQAIWMAGRAEFFSMMTVMAGMGTVMGFVTPLVVGEQPNPNTWAFWGFATLGLLVGLVATYPMNWMLVRIGWKHGMGSHG